MKLRRSTSSSCSQQSFVEAWVCSTCREENDSPVCEFCGVSQSSSQLASSQPEERSAKRLKLGVEPVAIDLAWAFKHHPLSLNDLKTSLPEAKINQVRDAISSSLGELCHRPFVILEGPSGSCKSSCVQLLARDMGLDLMEWEDNNGEEQDLQFDRFLTESCYPCLQFNLLTTAVTGGVRPKLVVLESLPERTGKQCLLQVLNRVANSSELRVCILYIHTVTGEGRNSLTRDQLGRIVGEESVGLFLNETVHFNPIADSRMKKTLDKVAGRENVVRKKSGMGEGMGDLRNALNNLQFQSPSSRDEAFDMLHAVGKLLRGPKPDNAGLPFPFEAVARTSGLPVGTLSAFVFENFYKYASSANAGLDAYLQLAESCMFVEQLCQSKWNSLEKSGGGEEDLDAMDSFAESVLARNASCWQTSPGAELMPTKMLQMQRPQLTRAHNSSRERHASAQHYLRTIALTQDSASGFLTEVLPFSIRIGRSQADCLLGGYDTLAPVAGDANTGRLLLDDLQQLLCDEDNTFEHDEVED
ncbi:hypothetical protein BASA81_003361 [Batrachochytrium salamandrivorans]|nr:hypothetical protein BASA81_003361 [Batrachochytrium salamandrivorans]